MWIQYDIPNPFLQYQNLYNPCGFGSEEYGTIWSHMDPFQSIFYQFSDHPVCPISLLTQQSAFCCMASSFFDLSEYILCMSAGRVSSRTYFFLGVLVRGLAQIERSPSSRRAQVCWLGPEPLTELFLHISAPRERLGDVQHGSG